MVIGVIQIVLTFIAACISFGGGVFCTIGGIIGFVFVVASLLCLPSGIVTVKEFRPMFFLGIVFGVVPTFVTNVGVEGIYAVQGLLSKI